jgi:hypothetical protein
MTPALSLTNINDKYPIIPNKLSIIIYIVISVSHTALTPASSLKASSIWPLQ